MLLIVFPTMLTPPRERPAAAPRFSELDNKGVMAFNEPGVGIGRFWASTLRYDSGWKGERHACKWSTRNADEATLTSFVRSTLVPEYESRLAMFLQSKTEIQQWDFATSRNVEYARQ